MATLSCPDPRKHSLLVFLTAKHMLHSVVCFTVSCSRRLKKKDRWQNGTPLRYKAETQRRHFVRAESSSGESMNLSLKIFMMSKFSGTGSYFPHEMALQPKQEKKWRLCASRLRLLSFYINFSQGYVRENMRSK